MPQWEYKTIQFETKGISGGLLDVKAFNSSLNDCGRDGWELINCFDTNHSYGATRRVIAVFKRQI